MKDSGVYWRGKCEFCDYATQFQIRPWLYWYCAKFMEPMAGVKKCENGPFKAVKAKAKALVL